MTLHVHATGESLLKALRTGRGASYAVLGRGSIDAALLGSIGQVAAEHGHTAIDALATIRTEGEKRLREFFAVAAGTDPRWRYAFSSGVFLAIPDYPDVALLFMLRAARALDPAATIHALIEDDGLARLASFQDAGGAPPVFPAAGKRALLRSARAAARSLVADRPRGPRDIVVITLGSNLATGTADAYFGDFAAALAQHATVMTVYLAPGKRVRFPTRPDAAPLEAFLRPGDPAAAWWGRKGRSPATAVAPADRALLDYLRSGEEAAGDTAVQGVMARAFDRLFAALKPRVLVYPFENRSWEKNLLEAARRHGVRRCVGYQHSSLTPRHLAFSGPAGARVEPLPDLILTCGEITAARVRAAMPRHVGVTVGTALRASRLGVTPAQGWGLLAPISSSRAEAWEMLRTLHALCALTSIPITLRTHPSIPVEDLYAQFGWPARMQLSRGRTLASDLQAASLVVYSSSTVALEGMLYGRLPIYLEIGDVPSGNPIEGTHDFVFRAHDAASLAQVIADIQAMPEEKVGALRAAARAYAERYLIEPAPAAVARMAELISAC